MIYKGSIDILKVSNLKVTFGLILRDDNPMNGISKLKNMSQDVVSRFVYSGNAYLKITKKEFLTIEIVDRNEAVFNPSARVNVNKLTLSILKKKLRKLLDAFKLPNIYYYKDGVLYVDTNISNQYNFDVNCNGKALRCEVSIKHHEDIGEQVSEGVAIILSGSEYTVLTYDEAEYLYDELTQINMHSLSLQLIIVDLLCRNGRVPIENRDVGRVLIQPPPTEPEPSVIQPQNKQPNTIPDI